MEWAHGRWSRGAGPAGRSRRPGHDPDAVAEARATACGSSPRTRTVPPPGRRYPSMISTVVVLPAPFGPRRATSSPPRPSATRRRAPSDRRSAFEAPVTTIAASAVTTRPRLGSRRDIGVLAIEVGIGQFADLDRADDAGARSTKYAGGRPTTRYAVFAASFLRVLDGGPRGSPYSAMKSRAGCGRVVRVEDADDGRGRRAARLGLALASQQRELVATGDARWPPEVQDDRLAAQVGQAERLAVEGGTDDLGRRIAQAGPVAVRFGPGVERTAATPIVRTMAMDRAARSGRRGVADLPT